MAEWSSWLQDLRRHLPECPDPLIEHVVKRTVQQFCAETGVWKIILDPVPVASGAQSVEFIPADGTDIVRIADVWLDGLLLVKTSGEQLVRDDAFWQTATGQVEKWLEEGGADARLYPIPTSNAALGAVARVVVQPSESAEGINDTLASKYRMVIVDGVLAALMGEKNRAWTNLEMSLVKEALFRSKVDEIKTKVALESVRVKSRPSWC